MAKGIVEHDLREATEENTGTTREKLYAKYGITEICGQVGGGVPIVMETGLPTLEKGLEEGSFLEQTGCITLLALMVPAVNTDLVGRGNRETQLQVTEEIEGILEKSPYSEEGMIETPNRAFISKNLSPGGNADLLAFAHFLYPLKEQQIIGSVISQTYPSDHRGIKQVKVLLEKKGITLDKSLNHTCCLKVPDTTWNYFTSAEA